jgi:hypothetical protein
MSRPVLLTAACSVAILVPVPVAALASSGDSSASHASATAHHKSVRRHQRRRHSAAVADNSGSVLSFDGSVLKVKRADGSTLSGRVDGATKTSCETEQQFEAEHATATTHRRRGATAKAARNGGPQSAADASQATEPNHPENEAEMENEVSNDAAEHSTGDDRSASCGMANMTPGTKVDAKFAAGSKSLLAEVLLVK